MSETYFIPLLLGTNRVGRRSELVARFVYDQMKKRPRLSTQLIDVATFKLPQRGYGTVLKDEFGRYRETISTADGLVIVVPEYNHGYPGVLKSVLDILLPEYIHKPVGLVGVSKGVFGGTRVIEALLPVMRELGLMASFTDLNFSQVNDIFDKQGRLLEKKYIERTDKFLTELLWLAETLRWGREHLDSEHD